MKGLFLKELYMMKKNCKPFFLIVVVFFACYAIYSENLFMVIYPTILAGTVPITLMSYDEKSRWNQYCDIFPYTRSQVVSVKYIMTMILISITIIISILIQMAQIAKGTFSWDEFMGMTAILFLMGFISPVISFPFLFKFDAEKGRLVYYVLLIILCVLGGMVSVGGYEIIKLIPFAQMMLVIMAACVLLMIVSWMLSIRIYEKKEL